MAGDGVRGGVLAGQVGVGGGGEAPAFFQHFPVHGGEGEDVFEAFEFADDEGAVGPGAGVGDIYMDRLSLLVATIQDDQSEL